MRKVLISLLVFAVFLTAIFLLKPKTEAYGNNFGHPKLTEKITELYNYIYEPDLTQKEIDLLIQGASDEDTPPRWINHFYDPTTEAGWLGKRLGDIAEEKVRKIAKIVFNKEAVSALTWAQDQDLQNSQYSLYQGNRTFNSAVLYYMEGRKEEAYYSLGYILHLIEDMTVPAHTRQDTHFDMPVPELFEQLAGMKFDRGEPYEKWVEESGNIDQNTINILKNNYQLICSSLESCLIYLANYSNNNFFSQDSILDKEYKNPTISKYVVSDKYINGYNQSNILIVKILRDSEQKTTDDLQIHENYWQNLSPVAILAGVEVVKYFHDQAEKAKNNEITIEKPEKISFWRKVQSVSPYGELARLLKYTSLAVTNPFALWFYDNQQDNQPKSQSLSLLTDLGLTPEEAQERADDLQELLDLLNNKEGGDNFTLPQFELPSLPAIEPPSLGLPALGPPTLELPPSELPPLELPPLLQTPEQDQPQTPTVVTYTGGGGSSRAVYPKILISEIQISPIEQRFVELYNPNDQEVNLTDWYIQRKTSTGTSWDSFVSSPKFEGKTIPAKGYFLISRQIENSDIVLDITLSDNNSLILKNPNREIVDKVGWGSAQEYETLATINPDKEKSVGRKWVNEAEQDTDNNYADFEIQNPTPKAKNVSFTPSPPLPPPSSTPAKILITEVQIEGENVYQDFIELYNLNNFDVFLKDYRLVKRAETSAKDTTIKSWLQESETKIPPKQYYLWASSTDENYPALVGADASTKQNISADNGVAIRYGEENTGEIIDAVGWGNFNNILLEGVAFPQNPPKNQSLARKITGENYQDTNDNSADFEIQSPTPKADNASILPPPPTTDTLAPTVVFNLASTQESLNFAVNFTITDLSVENVSPSGLAAFQFKWKEDEAGEWQEDVPQNISDAPISYLGTRDFTGRDETKYYFQVEAKDVNGNESDWFEISTTVILPGPEEPSRTVVINEIAWMGTKASNWDEWIELYNNTEGDIDFDGWKLIVGEREISLTGGILTNSFYLLERDEKATDVSADLIYGGERLSNDGEKLELRDASGTLIDLVDCSSEWFAGMAAPDYISMERIDSTTSGSDSENWVNNDPIIYQQGLDAAGNLIFGTPKAKNSAAFLGKIIYVDDDFADDPENHRWNTIQKGINDAEPGYLVLVNSGIYRENNIVIEKQLILRGIGDEKSPVIIDAKKDAGRADGILVKIDGVIIEEFKIKNAQAGIRLLNSNENILKNNVFEQQNNYGIYLESSNNNILFRNNVKTSYNCGIYLNSSSNNNLEENIANDGATHGICLISSKENISKENILKNNESQNNKSNGIYLKDSNLNQLEGNFSAENQSGISLINSKSNSLENNKTENNKTGIYLDWDSSENILKNNLMDNNCIANLNISSNPGLSNKIDESNLVDGKMVYYLQNQSNLVIDSSSNPPGLIYCFNCQNIVIKDITIDNRNNMAIYFYLTSNSLIENVEISESVRAISLEESHNNIIKGNLIKKNFNGIFLLKSNENKILDNIAEENGSQGYSPCFSGSPRFGLHLSQSNQNEIFNNLIINNPDGVELYDSRDNILFENTIEGNNDGIKIYRSGNNLFYHNNFVNNQKNVWDSLNQWKENYYSDYDEPEEGCNDLNGDNICDAPYINKDEYPFLQKNGWPSPTP